MTVKLSATLPKEFDANGMERLHAQLVQHPEAASISQHTGWLTSQLNMFGFGAVGHHVMN